jgi:DNA-binding transcriptional ArsR family regulator
LRSLVGPDAKVLSFALNRLERIARADRKQQQRQAGQVEGDNPEAAVLLKAISHPVRARALAALSQRIASPSELAAEQGEVVGYVAYHVRVLRKLGMIELVETRQVRGATQHFYRGTPQSYLDDDVWQKLLFSCG